MRLSSADSFFHGNSGRQSISSFIQVVGSNLTAFGGDKEEGVVVFTWYLDICFIAGLSIINITFISEVKVVAVEGSSFGVIKDSLIGKLEIKD